MLIILFLILLNCTGLLLKYFDIDRYIIILGFRFHIAAGIPFILLIIKKEFIFIKGHLKKNVFRYFGVYLLTILVPLFLGGVAYISDYISLADPDYFYEFGLSSIIDYPVYLFWNLPQFIMLGLFLSYASQKTRFTFPVVLTTALFVLAYEFIPLKKETFQVIPVIQASIIILFASALLIKLKNNLYMFFAILFTVIWSGVLLFGSSSRAIINLFFAKNYESWEGFFIPVKGLVYLDIIVYFGMVLIFFLVYLIVNSLMRKSD